MFETVNTYTPVVMVAALAGSAWYVLSNFRTVSWRTWLVFAAVIALGSIVFGSMSRAGDFNTNKAVADWYELHRECRLSETAEGVTLTLEESDTRCSHRDNMTATLRENDMCFDHSEQEWTRCWSD